MPPKKLINRSRPVGSRKPPKAPKSDPTPIPADWSESKPTTDWNIAGSTSTNGSLGNVFPGGTTPSTVASKAQSYTGLSQVGNGLSFPKFDPNQYFASDLFKDTSALERTTKEAADDLVQSIEEKRQTVRVATANIQLNQDVVKAGNEYLKLEGLAIDYASTGVNNETKFVNYQVAGVNKEIAINKLDQATERLTQGQLTLAGMQSITPLISQEWEQRRNLKLSQISSLKIEATKAREALEPKMMQLSQNFRQELEELN